MAQYKSEFLNIMHERGFIHQCSDFAGLDKKLCEGVQSAYVGYDATAPSLHVGNLISIMMLHWFQQAGHKPVTLMGGGTSKVGDPSGKDESRKLLTDDGIANNIDGIQQVFAKFLTYGSGKADAIMVNNADWLEELNYIEFLRDYGVHFTINRMLTFDSVKLRLEREQPLTFLEFNYMILQAYDFLMLHKEYGTILQMGGSDQWGNIINGVELGRRVDGAELFALTTPLLTTASGAKMGKSASGAVWLNADMLKPYDYFQYWRNTEDADVGRFLKLYTTMKLDEIAKLEKLQGQEINEAKRILAFEATKLCHGDAAAKEAMETAQNVFGQGKAGGALPTIKFSSNDTYKNMFQNIGFIQSGSEFKDLIKSGSAKIEKPDGGVIVITSVSAKPTDHGLSGLTVTISKGKKHHGIVEIE